MLKIAYLEAREERLRSLDRVIEEFSPHKRQDFCASTGIFFLGWIAEVLEVYVIISYQGGPAWLSLPSLSPPSPFLFIKSSAFSFLAASAPKTVGMCSPRGLRPFRHHLRAAPAVPGPGLDRNGMAMPVIAEKNGIEQK